VPKTPSTFNGDAHGNGNGNGNGNGSGLSPLQQVNTSLEQISDWLTKILVGVGLTQLATIPGRLWALGQNFAVAGSTPIALTIILNHAVVGFFAGYLMTRLFLAGAFREADALEETNWTAKAQRAEVLTETDNFPEALGVFQELVRELPASASTEEKRRAYEGVIFNALYQPPPDGFKEAIEQAEKYIKEEPDNPSARLYAYLAAAYGQRYQYEMDNDKRPKVLEESRNRAVAATRQALAIDPNIKELLRMMWDPKNPAKSPGDNDLEPFFNDPDMKKLLG
jgi:tetratricopeptide (TPR) repeat protein